MRNLRDLSNDMVALANGLETRANKLAIGVAGAVVTDLILHTPVDTSRALSNWQVSLADKNGTKIDAHALGHKGSSQQVSAAQAIADALSILSTKAAGQTVWIQNNLPYIQRLDEGYSGQAPSGFTYRVPLLVRNFLKSATF